MGNAPKDSLYRAVFNNAELSGVISGYLAQDAVSSRLVNLATATENAHIVVTWPSFDAWREPLRWHLRTLEIVAEPVEDVTLSPACLALLDTLFSARDYPLFDTLIVRQVWVSQDSITYDLVRLFLSSARARHLGRSPLPARERAAGGAADHDDLQGRRAAG